MAVTKKGADLIKQKGVRFDLMKPKSNLIPVLEFKWRYTTYKIQQRKGWR